jgi:hypothetical protein
VFSSKTPQPRGSLKLLILILFVGVGIGALGALLRPASIPPASEHNLIFRSDAKAVTISSDELKRRLLDRLVRHASRGDDISQSPDFHTFQRMFFEQPEQREAILKRLCSEDSPASLRLAFAEALPSRPRQARVKAMKALVLPLLDADDNELAMAAALALDRAELLEAKTSPTCRCRYGRSLLVGSSGTSWLLTWAINEGDRLNWSPKPLSGQEDGWNLGIQTAPTGMGHSLLIKSGVEPLTAGQILSLNGLPGSHLVLTEPN